MAGWLVLPNPFREMGAWRNSTEIQQRATPQGLDQRSKMKVVSIKDGAWWLRTSDTQTWLSTPTK